MNLPKGPQDQKRPADAIGCAIMVGHIGTGALPKHSQEERTAIAKKAAVGRWG
jgi:hypothetical protein